MDDSRRRTGEGWEGLRESRNGCAWLENHFHMKNSCSEATWWVINAPNGMKQSTTHPEGCLQVKETGWGNAFVLCYSDIYTGNSTFINCFIDIYGMYTFYTFDIDSSWLHFSSKPSKPHTGLAQCCHDNQPHLMMHMKLKASSSVHRSGSQSGQRSAYTDDQH